MIKGCLARAVVLGGLAIGATAVALAPQPAAARVHVGIGFGLPFYAPAYPAPYYYPPAYYPAPYAYAPAYAPPAYYAPPAQPSSAPATSSADQCREYNTTTVIGGVPQQMVGTACRQPDGTWRIVN